MSVHVFFEQRPTAVGFRAQTKAPSSNPELVEFQPGQVIFRTPLTCPPLRVQAIQPLTKSLTKTNKDVTLGEQNARAACP